MMSMAARFFVLVLLVACVALFTLAMALHGHDEGWLFPTAVGFFGGFGAFAALWFNGETP